MHFVAKMKEQLVVNIPRTAITAPEFVKAKQHALENLIKVRFKTVG
jgi:hypothetical protein